MGKVSDLASFRLKSTAVSRRNETIAQEFREKSAPDKTTNKAHGLNDFSDRPTRILSKSERHAREWNTYIGFTS